MTSIGEEPSAFHALNAGQSYARPTGIVAAAGRLIEGFRDYYPFLQRLLVHYYSRWTFGCSHAASQRLSNWTSVSRACSAAGLSVDWVTVAAVPVVG